MLTRRNSLRLQGFDYSLPEAYFITICCLNRRCLFGHIVDGRLIATPLGRFIDEMWSRQPDYFPGLIIDAAVVMPNHFHALLGLGLAGGSKTLSLPRVMQGFKAQTTLQSRKRGLLGSAKLWQPRYHDHIARSPASADRIREYIATNPQRWQLDRENEARSGEDEFDTWLEEEGHRAPGGAA